MSPRHRYLPVSRVSVGMILADELLDKLGHVLLPAGTVLTQHMLHSMEHHDIHQLSIVLEETGEMSEEDSAERQLKRDRIPMIFRHDSDKPPTAILLSLISKYRQEPNS